MKAFRLSEKMGIVAKAYDKNDKLIASVSDNGFSKIESVYRALLRKAQGKKICEFTIVKDDTDEYARYDKNLKRV